jgi:hypothetical protein
VQINQELKSLKERLSQPGVSAEQLCRLLPSAIFCCMMGYDATFAQIHTLKLVGQGRGQVKRAGYLAAMVLLSPHSEITILMFCECVH